MKRAALSALAAACAWGVILTPGATSLAHDTPHAGVKQGAQRRAVRVPIANFTLSDQNGRPFQLQAVKGRIVVVAFAYTTCPDVCPLITAAMRQIQTGLNPTERQAVYLLSVTTDPEVDEPKVLAAYAKRYSADLTNWSFLTGAEPALKAVWRSFGVKVQRKARGLVDHTTLTAVLDQGSVMRFAYYGAAADAKIVLQDIRSLLASR